MPRRTEFHGDDDLDVEWFIPRQVMVEGHYAKFEVAVSLDRDALTLTSSGRRDTITVSTARALIEALEEGIEFLEGQAPPRLPSGVTVMFMPPAPKTATPEAPPTPTKEEW